MVLYQKITPKYELFIDIYPGFMIGVGKTASNSIDISLGPLRISYLT